MCSAMMSDWRQCHHRIIWESGSLATLRVSLVFNFEFFYIRTCMLWIFFFFSSRRRHTRLQGDWSSDVCSSDLGAKVAYSAPMQRSVLVSGWAAALAVTVSMAWLAAAGSSTLGGTLPGPLPLFQIGRAACRGRGENSGVAVSLKKKKK